MYLSLCLYIYIYIYIEREIFGTRTKSLALGRARDCQNEFNTSRSEAICSTLHVQSSENSKVILIGTSYVARCGFCKDNRSK